MPNVDYRQFVDRFQSIERRLRNIELRPNPQLAVATGKTLTVDHSMTLTGADGYTLTIPKTGTVPVGTGTAGRIAEWVTDANTVQASTLAKTGAGVLTLAAAANYTLTIPATGTAALRNVANTFTALQTIDANLNDLLTLRSSSAGFGRLNLGSDTQTLLDFNTYTGTTLRARLQFVETGLRFAISNRASNGVIEFLTTTAGGAVTEAARITATQHLLIGTTTDNAQLSVNQSSTTGATPTLRLRQAALSEEFIRFDTTVGAGNPINTTALGAYYGRVRVHVEGVGDKWLALYD